MTSTLSARKLEIRGIVQGVGFRPFIYQLAGGYHLKGTVANTSSGVAVHVEGQSEQLGSFCSDIRLKKPPLAQIVEIEEQDSTPEGFADFSIAASQRQASRSSLISPDISVCEDCLKELFDPADRRFAYPFINCTNCGPRYTIIDDIPYDRPHTSMKQFTMCDQCRAEYDDPANRRFHAQPNACPVCGPHAALHDGRGTELKTSDPIAEAIRLLKAGRIVAIKGIGGFHLAVDAGNSDAVTRLRKRKRREQKPFALMAPGLAQINRFACVEPNDELLLNSPQRPIVLLKKRPATLIAEAVSPDNRYFGVMMPYTPLHYLLFEKHFTALVMTSANLSEEPIAIENDDAFSRLSGIADYFLVHNRGIYERSDDSIVRYAHGSVRMVRRSRGWVPVPVFLNASQPQILACGAELKNTVCLTKDKNAFLSHHIGDLENQVTYDSFKSTISRMKRILDIEPQVIAHDMHPDYVSTRYAIEQSDKTLFPVQHHHAHIVSCMAENKIDGDVIGLAFDGTGYGTDGHIWGGEVFIANRRSFSRAAHLTYVPMPGAHAAIRSPWRMAMSYLWEVFGDGCRNLELPMFESIPASEIDVIARMIGKRINAPLTSSLGRLFDGVAAILGMRYQVDFEGQAAMALEMIARDDGPPLRAQETYIHHPPPENATAIAVGPVISEIVRDLQKGVPASVISTRFHWTLIHMFSAICDRIRSQTGLNRIVLSGGVFQNAILLKGMSQMLENLHFSVYSHAQVPTNDGGISLGQAIVAAQMAA